MRLTPSLLLSTASTVLLVCGCSQSSDMTSPATAPADIAATETKSASPPAATPSPSEQTRPRRPLKPIQLGQTGSQPAGTSGQSETGAADNAPTFDDIVQALKPLQVMLGQWEGKTFKKVNGFAVVEQSDWAWDFQSDPQQPALRLRSTNSPYLKDARLTYLPKADQYAMVVTTTDGGSRKYTGEFTEPIRDVAGDDSKLQRTFKLKFAQVEPAQRDEMAEFIINQQANDRYLIEVYDQTGNRLLRRDTIANQREGTSFALSDTNYGDKTCIISQGLGTIAVRFEGQSFWVCCTGCKAAFEDDPKKWIDRYMARKDTEQK